MGLMELLLVLLIALLVIKPKELPRITKQLVQFINKIRGIKTKIETHLDDEKKLALLEKNKEKAASADKHYQKNDQ